MNPDYIFLAGILAGLFVIPSLLNALTESRAPRAAIAMAAVSGVLITAASYMTPQGYQAADVARVFLRVIGQAAN